MPFFLKTLAGALNTSLFSSSNLPRTLVSLLISQYSSSSMISSSLPFLLVLHLRGSKEPRVEHILFLCFPSDPSTIVLQSPFRVLEFVLLLLLPVTTVFPNTSSLFFTRFLDSLSLFLPLSQPVLLGGLELLVLPFSKWFPGAVWYPTVRRSQLTPLTSERLRRGSVLMRPKLLRLVSLRCRVSPKMLFRFMHSVATIDGFLTKLDSCKEKKKLS